MRTTLDLPNPLFKAAKTRAVLEGVPFKVVVIRALESELTRPMPAHRARQVRKALEEVRRVCAGTRWNGPPEMSFWEGDETSADPLKS